MLLLRIMLYTVFLQKKLFVEYYERFVTFVEIVGITIIVLVLLTMDMLYDI